MYPSIISCWYSLHRKFTRLPHLAGTEQNLKYAEQIQKEWQEFGLDSVELVPYDVLLSYPNKSQPNYISVVDELGSEVLSMLANHCLLCISHVSVSCVYSQKVLHVHKHSGETPHPPHQPPGD